MNHELFQTAQDERFVYLQRGLRGGTMGLLEKMMEFMIGRMSKEEKDVMMNRMMDRMLADLTPEEKQKLMESMMPKMMEGVNLMEMMPKMMMGMMGGNQSDMSMMGTIPGMMNKETVGGMPMMPKMMTTMMPECLNVMLPYVPKENKIDFVLRMIATLMAKGSEGMSEEEKKEFKEKVAEQL